MAHIPIQFIDVSVQFCKKINIKTDGNYILIEIPESNIVIQNKSKACMFCSSISELIYYKQSCICVDCIKKLSEAKPGTYYY